MTAVPAWRIAGTRNVMKVMVALYRRTGSAIGGRVKGTPVLLLTTTGRKSGRERTTPLTYGRDGDRYVVIASFGGSDHHPAWWLNLRANGEGRVRIGREEFAVTAAEVTGDERDRLWSLMCELYPGYDDYQRKTARQIPVVVLSRG